MESLRSPYTEWSALAEKQIGKTIGGYRVIRLLGHGGMGAVYEAQRSGASQSVALKTLRADLAMREALRKRFLTEARVLQKLGGRGTTRFVEAGEEGEVAFLAMELLDGDTLSQTIRGGGRLGLERAISLFDGVLQTMAHAHDIGVVHRDLKPENIFLCRDGTEKVLDFGLSRVLEDERSGELTGSYSSMGTPTYMAPEQALGGARSADQRSDVYSLGASMYRCLTGVCVHDAPQAQAMLIRVASHPAPSLASIRPDLPPWVIALVDRALSFERERRFGSAREMLMSLRERSTGVDPEPAHLSVTSLESTEEGAPAPRGLPPAGESSVQRGTFGRSTVQRGSVQRATLGRTRLMVAGASLVGLVGVLAVSSGTRRPSDGRLEQGAAKQPALSPRKPEVQETARTEKLAKAEELRSAPVVPAQDVTSQQSSVRRSESQPSPPRPSAKVRVPAPVAPNDGASTQGAHEEEEHMRDEAPPSKSTAIRNEAPPSKSTAIRDETPSSEPTVQAGDGAQAAQSTALSRLLDRRN